MAETDTSLEDLLTAVRACRLCRDQPSGPRLAHDPRPVLQAAVTARLLIAGQAPGVRVHASGRPFTDPSGERLRQWLAMNAETFYDASRVAILPMGFCFPGLSPKGADLPPRSECAPTWREALMAHLPNLQMIVTLGLPAARWHLGSECGGTLMETLANWPRHTTRSCPVFTLPHPSWRNNGLLKRHPFIIADIVPALQKAIGSLGL